MKDYYAILGLSPTCGKVEIRKAYRKQAKNFHPDHIGDEGTKKFLSLKEAYEILISSTARASYDAARKSASQLEKASGWNYRDSLLQNRGDPVSQAKLICFDLLHDREEDAVNLHDRVRAHGFFSLRSHLSKEDFMDYGFLLAEAYIRCNAVVKAFRLLWDLAELEEESPYFKHFYVEILNHLAAIVRHPLPDDADSKLRIIFISKLLRLSCPAREEACLRKLLSEILSTLGRYDEAAREVFCAYELAPNLAGLRETVKVLQDMGYTGNACKHAE